MRLVYLPVFAAAALATGGQDLRAQESGGGIEFTLDVSQSLRAEDNLNFREDPEGTSIIAETRLTFGVVSETSIDRLRLSAGTGFEIGRYADSGDVETDISEPVFNLSYDREAANAKLGFDARYRKTRIVNVRPEDDFVTTDLIAGEGEREFARVSGELITGLGGPMELSFGARATKRDYSGITNTDSFFDQESYGLSFAAKLAVQRNAYVAPFAEYENVREYNFLDTRQESTSYGLRFGYEISRSLRVSGSIAQSRVETNESIGFARITRIEEGPALSLSATNDLKNGAITASYDHSITELGERDVLRVGRSVDLKRGSLRFSLGVVTTDQTDARPLVALNFRQETPRGNLSAGVSQTPVINADNLEAIRTRVSVNYLQDINSLSSFDFSVGHSQEDVLDAPGDVSRTDVTMALRYELTRDWDLRTGYEFSRTESDSERRANAVFVSIDRSFNIRP